MRETSSSVSRATDALRPSCAFKKQVLVYHMLCRTSNTVPIKFFSEAKSLADKAQHTQPFTGDIRKDQLQYSKYWQ